MIVSTASGLGTLIVKKRVFEVVSLVGKLVQEYVQIVDSMTPDNSNPHQLEPPGFISFQAIFYTILPSITRTSKKPNLLLLLLKV